MSRRGIFNYVPTREIAEAQKEVRRQNENTPLLPEEERLLVVERVAMERNVVLHATREDSDDHAVSYYDDPSPKLRGIMKAVQRYYIQGDNRINRA